MKALSDTNLDHSRVATDADALGVAAMACFENA
jgi:hypothetical protein